MMNLDEIKERMKLALSDEALMHLAKGVRSGGFPMSKELDFISWTDWVAERFHAADQHIKKLYRMSPTSDSHPFISERGLGDGNRTTSFCTSRRLRADHLGTVEN